MFRLFRPAGRVEGGACSFACRGAARGGKLLWDPHNFYDVLLLVLKKITHTHAQSTNTRTHIMLFPATCLYYTDKTIRLASHYLLMLL